MSAKIKLRACYRSKKISKFNRESLKARKGKAGINQVVNQLNTINAQLIGVNTNLNNNLNNISTTINNNSSNINSILSSSLSTLAANLSDNITTTTSTIVSNINDTRQPACTVQQFFKFVSFNVPCGTTATLFENLTSTEKITIRARSFQLETSPCQATIIIVTMNGTVIETPLPPRTLAPFFIITDIFTVLDNVSSISIRCESSIQPPPAGSFCSGDFQVQEFRCVCCTDN